MVNALLFVLLVMIIFMVAMFGVARVLRRYDFVDVCWGLVFSVGAVTSWLLSEQHMAGTVATALVVAWGLRLAWHIFRRLRRTSQEDPRYVELRKNWRGSETYNMFTRVFLTQALLAFGVVLPVLILNLTSGVMWSPVAMAGLVVWIVGFTLESLADRQLAWFIKKPEHKGKLMDRGLWRYSRHPNYFGEITQWWGLGLLGLVGSYGVFGLIGPVLITYLIVFVSGLPPSERRFEGRPGWDEYKRRTSALIPWFRKS